MVTLTMDSGKMISKLVMDNITMGMVENMKATGMTMSIMVRVKKRGQIKVATKETICMVRKKDLESSYGVTGQLTRDSFPIMTSMAQVCTHGLMEESTQGSGNTTRWMVKEYSRF